MDTDLDFTYIHIWNMYAYMLIFFQIFTRICICIYTYICFCYTYIYVLHISTGISFGYIYIYNLDSDIYQDISLLIILEYVMIFNFNWYIGT